jgi:hypothetical protein
MRRTRIEHILSALPSMATEERTFGIGSSVPASNIRQTVSSVWVVSQADCGGPLFVWFCPLAWIEHIDCLARVVVLQKGRLWVIWKDANLAYEGIAGIFQGVLHARRQDDDIATGIRLRAGFRSALTVPFKNHNDFFRFVKMPRDYHSRANDVLMDVGFSTEFLIRNEVSDSSFWATRYLA